MAILAIVLPATALADLTQTVTLSTAGSTNLDLDTGATSSSGGDIQLGTSGITPQGAAKAINNGIQTMVGFAGLSQLVVQLYPGYSTATITTATLDTTVGTTFTDCFFVHTNGGLYAKVLVTGSTSSSITLLFTTFGASPGSGASGPPTITAIRNNSSNIFAGFPNYGIAPSSIFVIIGTGLADAGTPVLQSSAAPGLPLTLNGASISATVAGVTVHPAIYYTSPTQIAGVLPASTPTGTGTLTVSYKGVASNAQTLVVVPAALGINTFYTNSGVATDNLSGALITYTNSATPGETLVLWTTGLGADPPDSDTTYTSTPHPVATPLQIYVGGTPATIVYQGSAGYPGVDQIDITIPASTPNGCWITVSGVSGGVPSNITTIPVNDGGGACIDPVNGLSGNQITPASQTLRTGFVGLTQTTQTAASGAVTVSSNSSAAFEKYMGIYSPTNPVSPGGCLVNNLTPVSPGTFTGLDPGSIGLTGTGGLSLTLANQLGIKGAFSSPLAAGAIPSSGGTFTFKGSGGADVGSFTGTLTFSNPILSWTNPSVAASVSRSAGFTATWTGGNPGSYVFITGTSSSAATSTNPSVAAGFTCLANAGDGHFNVPGYILSALPAGKGGMEIQNDIYAPLPATGLDIGVTQGEIGISVPATFN
jgi:uncharacterized protein (TIGR03437 family)